MSAQYTARSGWTTVRLCNDCKQPIVEGDRCGCPHSSPFAKGVLVTICSDASGEHPIALGVVGRIGNGAFRQHGQHGSVNWFSLKDGHGVAGRDAEPTGVWARLRRDGDEAAVERFAKEKNRRMEHVAALLALRNKAALYRREADGARRLDEKWRGEAADADRSAKASAVRAEFARTTAKHHESEYFRLLVLADECDKDIKTLTERGAS